jgi:hypothetical protein
MQISDFTAAVWLLAERSRRQTEHPSSRIIMEYLQQSLPEDEAELLRDHLSLCSQCTDTVIGLLKLARHC